MVAVLVTVTVAFGMVAPLGSRTVPTMAPGVDLREDHGVRCNSQDSDSQQHIGNVAQGQRMMNLSHVETLQVV